MTFTMDQLLLAAICVCVLVALVIHEGLMYLAHLPGDYTHLMGAL